MVSAVLAGASLAAVGVSGVSGQTPASEITFEAPAGLQVSANRTLVVDAADYASETDAGYTISCLDATDVDAARLMSVERSSCEFTITPTGTKLGTASFTVPYESTGGDTHQGMISVEVGPADRIAFATPAGGTDPSDFLVGSNRSLVIDVSDYARDAYHTISCGTASIVSGSAGLISVVRTGCRYTVNPTGDLGTASFIAPVSSSGLRDYVLNAAFSVAVGPASEITLDLPPASGAGSLSVARNRPLVVDADRYATDGSYEMFCGDIVGVHPQIFSIVRDGCDYTVTLQQPGATGATVFTVPYRSAGGHIVGGQFTVNIGADSTISYAPPGADGSVIIPQGSSRVVDVSAYASETDSSGYAISCGDASAMTARIVSATHAAGSCVYTVAAASDASVTGAISGESFTVPLSSTGGDALDAVIPVRVGPASSISFNAPSDLDVNVGSAITIDASAYAQDGPYDITCAAATSISASLQSVAQVASDPSRCTYLATPGSSSGTGEFSVAYTSSGGTARTDQIPVTISATSAITYTLPTGSAAIAVAGSTLTVDASSAAHASNTITCADAVNIHDRITGIARTNCNYVITPGDKPGPAFFTIPFTSTDSNGVIQSVRSVQVPITVSAISYTAPAGLTVAAGLTLAIDAAQYAQDGAFTISCLDPASTPAGFSSLTRNTGTCTYQLTPLNSSAETTLAFTIGYQSSGGHTLNAPATIAVGPRSFITANPPPNARDTPPTPLNLVISSAKTLDLSSYVYDVGGYTIMCLQPNRLSGFDHNISRNGCKYSVGASNVAGLTEWDFSFTSSGGHTRTVRMSLRSYTAHISNGPRFNQPDILSVPIGSTVNINAYGYADRDGYSALHGADYYSLSCGDAAYTSPEISVTRDKTGNGCGYTIEASGPAGPAGFDIPFLSSNGRSTTGSIPIQITARENSDIAFSPPPESGTGSLQLGPDNTLIVDVSRYARDSGYAVGCADTASSIDPKLASVVSAGGCSYRVRAGSALGAASFDVTYRSSGGDIHTGTIPISIAPRTAPRTPPGQTPPPDPTTTTTTTTTVVPGSPVDGTADGTAVDPAPSTTLEPDQPGPRWNTLTVQRRGTAPAQIRQTLRLTEREEIYTWNPRTKTWTRTTRPTASIPRGTIITFRSRTAIPQDDLGNLNLAGGTRQAVLTPGWNIVNTPAGIARIQGRDFLLDPALTDCADNRGITAVLSYSAPSRTWAISLPCDPGTQARLTAGQNPPYRPLDTISPADTTYVYIRTNWPLAIAWNPQTQTYQPAS